MENKKPLKFIEITINRSLCYSTENPTQEYYYEDLLSSQIDDSDQLKSTKRKLKDLSISKRRVKEFNNLISERGIAERDALAMIERYSSIGDGYDKSDPFIDDSEIIEDEVTEDMKPKIDGFFLNEGPVEYCFYEESESLFTPTSKRKRKETDGKPKKTSPLATFSLSKFVHDYIEQNYHVIEDCVALIREDPPDCDPMDNLFCLVPESMVKPISSVVDTFFRPQHLDDFVGDTPALPSDYSQPVTDSLRIFLERRKDGPMRPDFEDCKTLFVLYSNSKRCGLTEEEWEGVLRVVAQAGGMRGDLSKLREFFQEIVKYFCGSIDNALMIQLTNDRNNMIQTSMQENDNKKGKVELTLSQKVLIKSIFLLFLMAAKVDKISEQMFLQQINTFNKYFVKKLGGVKSGVNKTILLNASGFVLKKIQRVVKRANDQAKIEQAKIDQEKVNQSKDDQITGDQNIIDQNNGDQDRIDREKVDQNIIDLDNVEQNNINKNNVDNKKISVINQKNVDHNKISGINQNNDVHNKICVINQNNVDHNKISVINKDNELHNKISVYSSFKNSHNEIFEKRQMSNEEAVQSSSISLFDPGQNIRSVMQSNCSPMPNYQRMYRPTYYPHMTYENSQRFIYWNGVIMNRHKRMSHHYNPHRHFR